MDNEEKEEGEVEAMMKKPQPTQVKEKEEDVGSEEHLGLTVTSKVLYMLGDMAAFRFTQWVELVRKRHRSPPGLDHPVASSCPSNNDVDDDVSPPPCLWDRLGNAAAMDIDSASFTWDTLSSLHSHSHSHSHSEDESSKALEVTVNSGGVVFFALFTNQKQNQNQSAAVIKFSSSRMSTQSERLGYEFAKRVGVPTPQGRVIHNSSPEWLQIKEAALRVRVGAADEIACCDLLEALDLSRCLFLMSYVHGTPLLETSKALDPTQRTAGGLGKVLLLDLLIRNEDRLPSRLLRWRGNPANLLFADSIPTPFPHSHLSDISDASCDFRIVAIDSGVPRRPPAGKRANDHSTYPKLVELLLNSPDYASNLLFDITLGKLGCPSSDEEDGAGILDTTTSHMASVVQDFRNGFRAALRDMQGFHIFLLTLHQKLDNSLRVFMNILGKMSSSESDKEDLAAPDSPSQSNPHSPSPPTKERFSNDTHLDYIDSDPRSAPRSSKESSESNSPMSRDNWHGRLTKPTGEPLRNLRLTAKLRDFHKFAKVDAELNKELEQWNEMLKNDAVKLCQENNFTTGFFEGSDNNCAVDAYELKIRLEHILERIALVSEAANTERPSTITSGLFIGGALAARSVFTLQHLGITHILCLCSNEIGQSDSQYPDLFEYRNFSISDNEDENIGSIFEEASEFIEEVEKKGGKVLVHCFEGRSRSATVVIAYLMLKKKYNLLEAWNSLKRGHRRAQPNDGFAKILQSLDKRLHGKVSIEWQLRKPMIKVCPICGSNAGLSSSSLKLHLQKSHKKLSSGSLDTAMTLEIQKALTALTLTRATTHHLP